MCQGQLRSIYTRQNTASKELFDRATGSLPGGDTRSVTHNKPFPTFISHAEGATVTTADDEELVDFLNNYTQAIHGHAPDAVVQAVCDRLRAGNGLGGPTEETIELAERITDRFPSIDRVRFANSGTEATMNAIRAAIAFTGNETILKVQGGYHGTHDVAEIGVSNRGRENVGIPQDIAERVITVPYNDRETLKELFSRHGDALAGFVLEPVMGAGGMVPARTGYLEAARDLTESTETLLLFDEVITSRLSTGGAQQQVDVSPDLTALGKYIGGGLPVGAFGGRADVMNVFHPEAGEVTHSGTFNGNPATMVGGVVTLDKLDGGAIERINGYGEEIRHRVNAIGERFEIPVQATGTGSLFQIHFTDEEVTDAASAGSNDEEGIGHRFYLAMRNNGVFMASRGMGNVSTAMSEKETEIFITAFENALHEIDENR